MERVMENEKIRLELNAYFLFGSIGYSSFPLAIIQLILIFFLKTEAIVSICIALWILIPGAYSGWFYYNKYRIKKYQ
jgi:hypothetical protein